MEEFKLENPPERELSDAEALELIADIFRLDADGNLADPDEPWPAGADVCEWVASYVRRTGRAIFPEWADNA
jgi:hypothetical protein